MPRARFSSPSLPPLPLYLFRYTTSLTGVQLLAHATAAPFAASKPPPLAARNASCNATLLGQRALYDGPLAFFGLLEPSGDAANCGFDPATANFSAAVAQAASVGGNPLSVSVFAPVFPGTAAAFVVAPLPVAVFWPLSSLFTPK